jgi:nitrogen regulatory protein PII
VLAKEGILSMTISEVGDVSQQPSQAGFYRGVEYVVDIMPKIKIEIIVEDDKVRELAAAISGTLRSGHLCDGQVSVFPVDATIYVRAGKQFCSLKRLKLQERSWRPLHEHDHSKGIEEGRIWYKS